MELSPRIVVAVDGSEPAQRAIDFASQLARAEHAELTFCNAIESMAVCLPTPAGGPLFTTSMLAALEDDGRAIGADAVAKSAAAGVRATSTVVHGEPAHVVEEFARTAHAGAIVVGTHGRRGLARTIAGSVAAGIVRHAAVPVFTVNAAAKIDGAGPILVAADASAPAKAALRAAIALARAMDAPLQLVHVFDDRDLFRVPEHPGYDPVIARRQAWSAAAAELDEASESVRASAIPFTSEMIEGEVAEELVRAAVRTDARVIATGTHGRNPVARAFLGSVAERLLCTSPIPVMTVRS